MKSYIQKLSKNISHTLLWLSCFLITSSFQAFAGTWSSETGTSGMDSVQIYIPTTAPALENKRALMINLHGCSMKGTDMRNYGGWEATADKYGMVVAAPDTPGSSNWNCWDYYGSYHTRSNKHNNEIIVLTNELIGRSELNIDPRQVYITGFSSGGGQANVIACLAPDLFAGVGSAAGPGLGSESNEYGDVPWDYSAPEQTELCENLSGYYSPSFSTQIYSTIHGTSDTFNDPAYNDSNAEIMSIVYGATNESAATYIATNGSKVIFSDSEGPRVSKISVTGLAHAWSTGTGGFWGNFTNSKVDYPSYVTQWFFDNNRRLTIANPIDFDEDGYSEANDCNDQNFSINPGVTEICEDGIDQNCSGSDKNCDDFEFECKEYTTSNTAHYNASPRRATYWYHSFKYHYYAKGSSEELALTGPYSIATVSETSEGYFQAGSCPSS